MVEQGYHDNIEHNYVFTFKNMAARFLEISGEEIQKFAVKAVNKNTKLLKVKTIVEKQADTVLGGR